jgi:hypothetical protein
MFRNVDCTSVYILVEMNLIKFMVRQSFESVLLTYVSFMTQAYNLTHVKHTFKGLHFI